MIWFGKKKEEKHETAAPIPEIPKPAVHTPPPVAAPTVTPPVVNPAPAPAVAASVPSAAAAPAAEAKPAKPSPKALYYSLMNALYDAVLVVDDKGHLMDCNERVTTIFGYEKDEIWDMPITQLVPALNPQVFMKMKNGLQGTRRVLVNARCRRKDATTFQGEVGAGLMTLVGKNMVVSIRNIEKRSPAKAIIKPANQQKQDEAK